MGMPSGATVLWAPETPTQRTAGYANHAQRMDLLLKLPQERAN